MRTKYTIPNTKCQKHQIKKNQTKKRYNIAMTKMASLERARSLVWRTFLLDRKKPAVFQYSAMFAMVLSYTMYSIVYTMFTMVQLITRVLHHGLPILCHRHRRKVLHYSLVQGRPTKKRYFFWEKSQNCGPTPRGLYSQFIGEKPPY